MNYHLSAVLRRGLLTTLTVVVVGRFIAWPAGTATPAQASPTQASPPSAQNPTTILQTSRILDGTGAVLENRDIVINEGRITAVVPRGSATADLVYDLTSLTVLPGYIDTHVHITPHFEPSGKLHSPDDESAAGHTTLYAVENAYRTLLNGITTVQSLGAEEDTALKTWIERGDIPGPRVLSSLGAVSESTGNPVQIRDFVRDRAAAGADVIKIFASTSIRFGGVTTLSAAQLDAACQEARAQGLRAVVHAHRSDAVKLAADAGCSQIEHGWLLEPNDLDVIAESGMYLGNQIHLLFENYAANGERFDGVASYTMEGFANLQAARPGALDIFRRALDVPGLRIVYSTDANAGSHGRNTDELVAYIVDGGQGTMDAIISATSRAAESLGLADRIGSIAPGLDADIIALDGDPLSEPEALGRVAFVMRAGQVYKNAPAITGR